MRHYSASQTESRRIYFGLATRARFSRYENITGMYLEAGEQVVLVGNTAGKQISLLIPDWMRKPAAGIEPTKDPNGWGLHKQKFDLKEGVNILQVKKPGLAYVSYFDDEAGKCPQIAVHFPTGKVNGFFDVSRHTNADWDRLLDSAVNPQRRFNPVHRSLHASSNSSRGPRGCSPAGSP